MNDTSAARSESALLREVRLKLLQLLKALPDDDLQAEVSANAEVDTKTKDCETSLACTLCMI
jgi:hypothetical protein